jgi:AcrR family transcriptional regulator
MRVSAETKAATRQKILETARLLFAENGFQATTTREIAAASGIATGTLFNYFPTKEAIVGCLASEAGSDALAKFQAKHQTTESLEEDLFALVATGMRKLKPLRKHLPSLLETLLSPLASGASDESASLRVDHLEAVVVLAKQRGFGELSSVALQLYWTLYTGILVFWATDKSPKQEDTLALMDHSLHMFAGWLRNHGQS